MFELIGVGALAFASAFGGVAPRNAPMYSDDYIVFDIAELTDVLDDYLYQNNDGYDFDIDYYMGNIGYETFVIDWMTFNCDFRIGDYGTNAYELVDYSLDHMLWLDVEDIEETPVYLYLTNNDSLVLGQDQGESIVGAIGSGLTFVESLARQIGDAFVGLVIDDSGDLTPVSIFAFSLFGIGISVGVVKLTFNWLNGRHGM